MVTVTVSETYDLSTKPGKIAIVGIHTPKKDLITKTYPGLVINSKMFKFVKCDVKMACASRLPADPLQVGVESGQIAPQDMFNPILYKAMSNDAMSNFELRIHGLRSDGTTIYQGNSLIAKNDDVTGNYSEEAIYYNLLANHKGWKIAHPQRGVSMVGLRPLVYERLYTVGQNGDGTTSGDIDDLDILKADQNGSMQKGIASLRSFRGRPHAMPWMNCTYLTATSGDTPFGNETSIIQNAMPGAPGISPIYVGALILPPSKLNVLYYRLVIRWTIAFSGIRPIQEIAHFSSMQSNAPTFYGIDYTFASKNMDIKFDMVDTQDADLEKIMEGV